MKKLVIICMCLLIGGFSLSQANSSKKFNSFKLKRGIAIDYNGDKSFDEFTFELEKKHKKSTVCVDRVEVIWNGGSTILFPDFEIEGKTIYYFVDIAGLQVGDNFVVRIFVQNSDDDGSVMSRVAPVNFLSTEAGGPGGPKETVVILEYP